MTGPRPRHGLRIGQAHTTSINDIRTGEYTTSDAACRRHTDDIDLQSKIQKTTISQNVDPLLTPGTIGNKIREAIGLRKRTEPKSQTHTLRNLKIKYLQNTHIKYDTTTYKFYLSPSFALRAAIWPGFSSNPFFTFFPTASRGPFF